MSEHISKSLPALQALPTRGSYQRALLRHVDLHILTAVKEGENRQNILTTPRFWPEGSKLRGMNGQYLRNCALRLRNRGLLLDLSREATEAGSQTVVLQLTEKGKRALDLHLQIVETTLEDEAQVA